LIRLECIWFSYGGHGSVLEDLDFLCREGDRIGIHGAIGSGKTTLLHLVVGLIRPEKGKVELFGRECKDEKGFMEARKRMGFLFQDSDDQLFCPTVAEDVAFGPRNLGKSTKESLSIVQRTLQMLDIEHLRDRITYELSGGEKRLVALATALAMEPDVLLLDEPTLGLTEEGSDRLSRVLDETMSTYIIVSHDMPFLEKSSRRLLAMHQGRLLDIDMKWTPDFSDPSGGGEHLG